MRAGTTSSRELVDTYLERIQRLDPKLNAICHIDADAARARADEIDADVAAGNDPGPLAGVPVGVKELAAVDGWPDTEACLVYKARVADHDSTEVARLRAAGAVLTAQTTASEFGSVSFTNTPLHGITRNPWNPAHTPGGSSGGSAAAVAAGMLPICTGGDGGGSIRIPASYSGLLGMKTTYGLSGTGPGAFSFSETSVQGAMARSVRDSARYLDVITGPTLTDPHSLPKLERGFEAPIVSGEAIDDLRGLRVAWSDTLGYGGADPAVSELAWHAAEALIDAAGFELVDIPVELPEAGHVLGSVRNDQRDGLLLRGSPRPRLRSHRGHAPVRPVVRAPAPRRAPEGDPRTARDGRGVGRGLRSDRSAAHADHADAGVRGRRTPPWGGQRERGVAHGALGRVLRAVQPHGPARLQRARLAWWTACRSRSRSSALVTPT